MIYRRQLCEVDFQIWTTISVVVPPPNFPSDLRHCCGPSVNNGRQSQKIRYVLGLFSQTGVNFRPVQGSGSSTFFEACGIHPFSSNPASFTKVKCSDRSELFIWGWLWEPEENWGVWAYGI